VLGRADFRLSDGSQEASARLQELLTERLTRSYGVPVAPEILAETVTTLRRRGRGWQGEGVAYFLHQSIMAVRPVGLRGGLQLIAVRREVLDLDKVDAELASAFRSSTALSHPMIAADLKTDLGDLYTGPLSVNWTMTESERLSAERQARAAILRLLQSAGEGSQRAALLVAADELAQRLGTLLVARVVKDGSEHLTEAPDADSVREELAPYGIRYGRIGHYSGVLEHNRGLLQRAWAEFPSTSWGQRAFLVLQTQSCDAATQFGCQGLNCFREIIRRGEEFLLRYPQTPFRKEQLHLLAQAYQTWWSLSNAPADDLTVDGADVGDKQAASRARVRAIELYEDLIHIAPQSPEAEWGRLRLPRLKLSLDTGERSFYCYSD
jgi:hypothetical protein